MQVASGFLILSSFQISIKFYLKLQGHYMASYTCMYCQIKSKIKLIDICCVAESSGTNRVSAEHVRDSQ